MVLLTASLAGLTAVVLAMLALPGGAGADAAGPQTADQDSLQGQAQLFARHVRAGAARVGQPTGLWPWPDVLEWQNHRDEDANGVPDRVDEWIGRHFGERSQQQALREAARAFLAMVAFEESDIGDNGRLRHRLIAQQARHSAACVHAAMLQTRQPSQPALHALMTRLVPHGQARQRLQHFASYALFDEVAGPLTAPIAPADLLEATAQEAVSEGWSALATGVPCR